MFRWLRGLICKGNKPMDGIRVDVFHHFGNPSEVNEMLRLLREIHSQNGKIMASLQDIIDDVSAETTAIGSLTDLVAGLKQQLADALSGVNLPPAVQAKVDAIFAGVDANKQKILDALAANVPPTP